MFHFVIVFCYRVVNERSLDVVSLVSCCSKRIHVSLHFHTRSIPFQRLRGIEKGGEWRWHPAEISHFPATVEECGFLHSVSIHIFFRHQGYSM